MEIFLFCVLGYFVIGLVWTHQWSKSNGMPFYWPFVFTWPFLLLIAGFIWLLHILGFRIH